MARQLFSRYFLLLPFLFCVLLPMLVLFPSFHSTLSIPVAPHNFDNPSRNKYISFSDPVKVVADKNDNSEPFLSTDSQGNAIIIWARTTDINNNGLIDFSDTSDIWLASLASDLATGAPTQLTTDISDDFSPSFSGDAVNGSFMTWVSYRSANMDIWAVEMDDPLHNLGTPEPITVNISSDLNPSITHNRGAPILVWTSGRSGNDDIFLSRFENDGTWSSPQMLVGTEKNESDPFIFSDEAGVIRMVWCVDGEIYSSFSEDGVTFSDPEVIPDVMGASKPRATQDHSGTYWLTWCQTIDSISNVMVANATHWGGWNNVTEIFSAGATTSLALLSHDSTLYVLWDSWNGNIRELFGSTLRLPSLSLPDDDGGAGNDTGDDGGAGNDTGDDGGAGNDTGGDGGSNKTDNDANSTEKDDPEKSNNTENNGVDDSPGGKVDDETGDGHANSEKGDGFGDSTLDRGDTGGTEKDGPSFLDTGVLITGTLVVFVLSLVLTILVYNFLKRGGE